MNAIKSELEPQEQFWSLTEEIIKYIVSHNKKLHTDDKKVDIKSAIRYFKVGLAFNDSFRKNLNFDKEVPGNCFDYPCYAKYPEFNWSDLDYKLSDSSKITILESANMVFLNLINVEKRKLLMDYFEYLNPDKIYFIAKNLSAENIRDIWWENLVSDWMTYRKIEEISNLENWVIRAIWWRILANEWMTINKIRIILKNTPKKYYTKIVTYYSVRSHYQDYVSVYNGENLLRYRAKLRILWDDLVNWNVNDEKLDGILNDEIELPGQSILFHLKNIFGKL